MRDGAGDEGVVMEEEGLAGTVSCLISRLGLIPGWLIFQQEYHDRTKMAEQRRGEGGGPGTVDWKVTTSAQTQTEISNAAAQTHNKADFHQCCAL